MILTALSPSRDDRGRFELTLEDGRQMIVSEGVIAQFYLYAGKDLDETTIEEIRGAFNQDEARKKALRVIDTRAMSRKEVIDKLVQKGEDRAMAEDAADWLAEIGAIDDREYAAMVVRHYGAKGYGPMRIRQELGRRGVDRELWDDALGELPEQDDQVLAFIQSKLRGERPDRGQEKKVADGLYRRGFSWDEINAGMRRYLEALEEDE